MVVRKWALQILPLLVLALSAQAADKSYNGQVYEHGSRLRFDAIGDDDLSDDRTADLYVWFDGAGTFDAEGLQIGINGQQPHGGKGFWKQKSEWQKIGRDWVLVVRVGESLCERLPFGLYVRQLQKSKAFLRLWLHSPMMVRRAELHFRHGEKTPYVILDSVVPKERVFTDTRIRFDFHASAPSAGFECALDGSAFRACPSPTTIGGLSRWWHRFHVRALSANGKSSGPVLTYWFAVVEPAIDIRSVKPAENPTTRTDISVAFSIRPAWGTVSAECRLDDGAYQACTSPVSYSHLSQGAHAVDIRRVTRLFWWFYQVSYPTTYRWEIKAAPQPPVLEWVSTPPALTRSDSAAFAFRADQTSTTFSCALDGASPSACTSPLNLTSLAEGGHTLQVIGTGAAGVSSAPLSFHWVIDVTAPVVTLSVTPQQSPINSDSLTASFSANEPSTFACALDGAAPSACQSPLVLNALAEGHHTITISATDAAGNVSQNATYSWDIDRTAPTITLSLVAPASLPTNSQSATFHLTSSEAATIACQIDGGASFACGSDFDLTQLAEGTHTLAAQGTDAAGNAGAVSTFQWQIDLTPPVVTIDSVDPSENPTAIRSLSLAFSVSESAGVWCNRDASGSVPCSSPYVINELADGQHEIALQAKDTAGNFSEVVRYRWMVAGVATATLTAVTPPESPTNSRAIRFEFTSNDTAIGFICSVDSAAATACSSPLDLTGIADGPHHFAVSALNVANQPGPAAEYDWVVDATAPVITAQGTVSGSSLRVDFTLSEPARATCQLDTQSAVPCTSPYTASGIADGAHAFTLRASDTAGNAATPWTYHFTVSTIAIVTLGQPTPAASPVASKDISIPFTSAGATGFVCSLDGAAPAACASPAVYTALTDGAHRFTVSGLNGAGQPGPAVEYDWTIDTTAPTLTLGTITPSENPTAATTISIAFTASETATFRCSLDGAAPAACTSPFTASGLADAVHTWRITASDSLGNTSAEQSYSWRVISVAHVTLGSPTPAGSLIASHTLTIPFSSTDATAFDCSLDGATPTACVSPQALSGVADGAHHFAVRGLNPAGAPGPAATYDWTVDTTAPVLAIASVTPSGNPTASTSMSLSFTTSEPATVRCQLDGGSPTVCTSPYSAMGLADGAHTVTLTAQDSVGNTASPQSYSWSIITVATVTLTSVTPPDSLTNSRSMQASFSSPNSSSFVCSLDGAAATACASPISYSGLGDGNHTFSVAALNPAGGAGPAATHAWTIDATAPTVTITATSPSYSPTSLTTLTVAFSANDSATFRCAVDGGTPSVCASPWATPTLSSGAHTVAVTATDSANNTSAPATYSWTVDTTPLAVTSITFNSVTGSSVFVSWQTNQAATSQLEYATNSTFTGSSLTAVDGNYVSSHAMTLSGLSPNTVYFVRAISVDRDGRRAVSSAVSFRTLRN